MEKAYPFLRVEAIKALLFEINAVEDKVQIEGFIRILRARYFSGKGDRSFLSLFEM